MHHAYRNTTNCWSVVCVMFHYSAEFRKFMQFFLHFALPNCEVVPSTGAIICTRGYVDWLLLSLQRSHDVLYRPYNDPLWHVLQGYGFIWVYRNAISTTEHRSLASGPFYKHVLILIPAWISNYIHYELWDEIIYPFLNFSVCTVEV